ncbi:MAG: DNA integrity scanning diadenylate cyclase DisA [Clostridia bacterium]|nr:dNA integrity scanning protein DisA [Clostridium sp. CAG:452]HJJ04199.1 DNA integrity scanning diadenylate cyclase DisA [Clostridiaceae bacterium]
MAEKTKNDEELINILKIIAPGTLFREGLDNILKAKTGALIIIGDTKEVLDLVDGGFRIDEEYTPARLYELAKMDGAIVLSKDLKRILLANTQIIPSPKILTQETGTRHRTAERTAKQTGELVVSISQRRNIITVFKGDFRYTIEDSSKIVTKANQALQTLENYKRVFDTKLRVLNEYEFNDIVTLDNVITCIQRAEMVNRVAEQVKRSIYELGADGVLVKMQLEELIEDLPQEELLIIKDYIAPSRRLLPEKILQNIRLCSQNELIQSEIIARFLGYEQFDNYEEVAVYPRGYRILNKIPRMPNSIVTNLVKTFKSFQHILLADVDKLDEVEGIGEVRARTIKQSLRRMQEQFVFDNLMI